METIDVGSYRRVEVSAGRFRPGAGALFLDRDGVVLEKRDYLYRIEDAAIIPEAAALARWANEAGRPVVLITNQAGIGRGYYTWEDFKILHEWMGEELARAGAQIDATYACAYHADAFPPYRYSNHPWRKPAPGMLLQAARDLGLNLTRSWFVGDHMTDVEAGLMAGLAGVAHVLTGDGPRHRGAVEMLRVEHPERVFAVDDATKAAEIIERGKSPY